MNEMTPAPVPDYQPDMAPEAVMAPGRKFRLHKFLMYLRRYWWVPAATIVLFLAGAGFHVMHQPATFVSTGSMWETVKLRLPEGDLFTEDGVNFVGTQNDLLQSSMLRDRVLASLRAASNTVSVPVDMNGDPLPVKINVSESSKSAVFELQASGPQADYTRAYLEALMQAYLEYKGEIRKEISGVTLASITGQVQLAEQELKNEQDTLTDFQRTNNMAILQEEGTVAGGYLTKLKTELSDLQLEEQLETAASAGLAQDGAGTNQNNWILPGAAAALPDTAVNDGMAAEMQRVFKELEMLKIQHATLSTNLREMHPKMVQLNADIQRDQRELDLYQAQAREQMATAQKSTKLKMENVQNSIKEWEARVVEANSRIAEAERLKINVQRAQGEYDRLAALVQNVNISRNIDQEDLAILEHASPAKHSRNAEKRALGLAVAAGIGLGFGFIVLLSLRDEKFGSILEINETLGDSVIAQVPEMPGSNGEVHPLGNGAVAHIYAESYRSLRSGLLFLSGEVGRPRVMLITSTLPGEGKSTIAVNLARTLAFGGARVLLVDADLRRGGLHNVLGMEPGPGLAHLLDHPSDVEKICRPSSVPNLWFVACGARMANPGDRFIGAPFDRLLGQWRDQFDYVLIDSSPIFAADDATTIAPRVDGTLMVVRSRFASARQVRLAVGLLAQRRARVLGVVFNRADASSHSFDYYKYSEYYPVAQTS